MKKLILIFLVVCFTQIIFAQNKFSKHFKNSSLRIDFTIGGNDTTEILMWQQLKKEPLYGGSINHLIDDYQLGDYRCNLYDAKTKKLIFSKGFSSLFREWQTVPKASEMNRSFYQVVTTPFPKREVVCEIQTRQKNGQFKTLSSQKINPASYAINTEKIPFETITLSQVAKPNKALDIVFLGEGYSTTEMNKFVADAKRVSGYILNVEPYKTYKAAINFYAVKTPSHDSGIDIPYEKIFKHTAFDGSYNTFDMQRYVTIQNIKALFDAAASVPYDHIFVLVNSDIYGGGAFYNHYSCCYVVGDLVEKVSTHELMHGLFGLADEYYDIDDEITFYYDLSVEPWNMNLTTLVDFEKKWKHLVSEDVPIPTPRKAKYRDKVGAYEGGSYVKKGVFSPMQDCKMKSNKANSLCPVCKNAAEKLIKTLVK